MFNQSAFSSPEQALAQFKDYVTGLQTSQGWSSQLVGQLIQLADDIYNEVKRPIYLELLIGIKTDIAETTEFWSLLYSESPAIFDELTNGNPQSVPKYNSFMAFLASASDTANTIDETTGIKGAINVAQEQLEEVAEEITEEKERYKDLAPFVLPVLALGGLFV